MIWRFFRQQPMEWHGCPAATWTACWFPIALQSSVLNTGNLATILMRLGTPYFPENNPPRPSRMMKPLGMRRKTLAFVVALGILSFFWPLITIDPPVLERTQWSAWNVAWQIYQGNLPNRSLSDTCERCDRQWVLALFYVPKSPTAVYLLMVLALVLLCVSRSAWPLGLIGTMGAILTWASWKWDSTAFEELFYGGLFAGHVRLGQFMFLLLLVMVALVVISRTEDLDEAV